jgi:hypothetical protein
MRHGDIPSVVATVNVIKTIPERRIPKLFTGHDASQ